MGRSIDQPKPTLRLRGRLLRRRRLAPDRRHRRGHRGPRHRDPRHLPHRRTPASPSTHPRRARLHHQRRPPRPDPHRSEQGVTQGSPEGGAATAVPGRTMITVILFYAEYLRQIRTQIFRDHASGLPGWRKTRRSGRPWECSLSGVVPCGESRGAVSVVRRPGPSRANLSDYFEAGIEVGLAVLPGRSYH